MFRKFIVLVLMVASCGIFLPTPGAASTDNKKNSSAGIPTENLVLQQGRGRGRGRGRNDGLWSGRRRSGRWYGYRNYGQYRRTQVGNRRYRWARRPYWRDGRRYVRLVRIYY